jgi:peptide/nickel transport system substrate-binding protein
MEKSLCKYLRCFLCFLCFLLAALSTSAFAQVKELSIALNEEFESLNPIVNTMLVGMTVQDAILRPLVALTPEGKPYPILIKEIPSLENHKAVLVPNPGGIPGLRVQIEMLPEAKWSDGQPLTCQDLKLSWMIGSNNNVSTPLRSDYLNISKIDVDVKNPKNCSVLFKEARWDFYLYFPRPVAAHLEQKIFDQFKDQPQAYERNSLYVRDPAQVGLYNGPYRVSELKVGSYVALVPNTFFYGEKPHFDKVIFKFILNSAAMEANLLTGGVQIASSSGFSFDQALVLEKKVKMQKLPYEVLFVPSVVYAHIDVNLDNEKLADKRVRKAMSYALNREELTKAFFENRQTPAYHFSTPLDVWYTDDPKIIVVYPYNKTKANRLLEEAGWVKQADGIRVKDGKKLSFTLTGVADNKLVDMVEAFMQAEWKQVGIQIQIKNYPARVLFSEILRKRQFELGFYSWVSTPNQSQRNALHSSMIPTAENSWSGTNRTGWKNPDVDRWLDQVEAEFNPKKRILLMHKILHAYTEELPGIPAFYRANTSVIPKGLKNYKMSGHVFTEYLQIEKWTF